MKINKIYNAECLEFMKSMPDGCIDLVLTSPPYNNLRTYNGFTFDFQPTAKELFRVVKEGGVVVWVVGDETINGSESGTSFTQALYFKEIGFNLHDTMIWRKQTFTDTGSLRVKYGNVFEYMFIISKGKVKTFNPIKDRENTSSGSKKHGTVRQKNGETRPISSIGKEIPKYGQRFNIWKISNAGKSGNKHPATFPKQLAKDHITSWSNEGDIIFDPFMGSGTTAIACLGLGRKYIGCEISSEYCKLAEERIKLFNQQLKLF